MSDYVAADADPIPPREAPSKLLGLSRSDLEMFWEQSLKAGGKLYPITRSASLLCRKAGQEAVIFSFPCACRARLKNAKGFSIAVESREDGGTDLRIEHGALEDVEMFAFISLDLLELDFKFEGDSPRVRFGLITGRLKAWRQFMQDRSRRLTPQQELGLAGELHFLRRSLEKGVSIASVSAFWTGPKRAARDFSFGGETFAEVKTSTAALPLRAKIESLDQLDVGTAKELLLCAVVMRREESEAGAEKADADKSGFQTLDEMASEIEVKLGHDALREEFLSLLITAGLTAEQREASASRFRPEGMHFFKAEHLPRLTPGKIQGIVKATYEIELLDAAGLHSAGSEDAVIPEEEAWKLLTKSGGAEAGTAPDAEGVDEFDDPADSEP